MYCAPSIQSGIAGSSNVLCGSKPLENSGPKDPYLRALCESSVILRATKTYEARKLKHDLPKPNRNGHSQNGFSTRSSPTVVSVRVPGSDHRPRRAGEELFPDAAQQLRVIASAGQCDACCWKSTSPPITCSLQPRCRTPRGLDNARA